MRPTAALRFRDQCAGSKDSLAPLEFACGVRGSQAEGFAHTLSNGLQGPLMAGFKEPIMGGSAILGSAAGGKVYGRPIQSAA